MALMEAHIVIRAALGPLKKGLSLARAAVRKAVSAMQATLNKMVSISKKAFLGLAAVMGVATWAAMKQEEAEARLAVVLKSTGNAAGLTKKQLIEQAKALQKVTTYGDETIMSLQAILLTFKEVKGDMFERATEVILDMSKALGQDLKQGAIQVGKALNDPILGVTALRRVGVMLTEEQTEMVKSFVDTGNVAKAQALILKELESEFGGMASVIDTARGALTQMKNALGDVLEVIGKPFLDNIKRTSKAITEWANTHQAQIGRIAASFDRLVEVGVRVISEFTNPLIDSVLKLGRTFAGFATAAKLERILWEIGEWTDKIWMRIKLLWTAIKVLWSGENFVDLFKYGLDKTVAQFEVWGKQILIIMEKSGQDVANALLSPIIKAQEMLFKLGPKRPLMKITPTGPPTGTLRRREPWIKPIPTEPWGDVFKRAGEITAREVPVPPMIRAAHVVLSRVIKEFDKQIDEKWKQIEQESRNVTGFTKGVSDLVDKPTKDIKKMPAVEAAKFGTVGLREAWSQMVAGMKADPAVMEQRKNTDAVKDMAKKVVAIIKSTSQDEVKALATAGTVGA